MVRFGMVIPVMLSIMTGDCIRICEVNHASWQLQAHDLHMGKTRVGTGQWGSSMQQLFLQLPTVRLNPSREHSGHNSKCSSTANHTSWCVPKGRVTTPRSNLTIKQQSHGDISEQSEKIDQDRPNDGDGGLGMNQSTSFVSTTTLNQSISVINYV